MEPPKIDDQDWTDIAAKAQTRLRNSIPTEWRIPHHKLPQDDRLDVTGFPRECGLLTPEELKITESFATDIVGAIAAGEWTAEEVTRAFCKRAAVAHQLVRSFFELDPLRLYDRRQTDIEAYPLYNPRTNPNI